MAWPDTLLCTGVGAGSSAYALSYISAKVYVMCVCVVCVVCVMCVSVVFSHLLSACSTPFVYESSLILIL